MSRRQAQRVDLMPTLINPGQLSAQCRGLWYGDGGFTTLRVVAGAACFWPRHLERLQDLARVLDLQVNWDDLHIALNWVVRHMAHGVVKIILCRDEGGRGYLPPRQEALALVFYWPDASLTCQPDIPLTLPIEAVSLPVPMGWVSPALRGLKTLNRLEQVLLRQALEARQSGEGLCFDHADTLVSGVQSNVFFLRQGRWFTPGLQHAGIAGTLRAELLDRAAARRVVVEIGSVPRTQVTELDAVFFCNALRGMQPVRQLDGRPLNVAAVQQLHDLLT